MLFKLTVQLISIQPTFTKHLLHDMYWSILILLPSVGAPLWSETAFLPEGCLRKRWSTFSRPTGRWSLRGVKSLLRYSLEKPTGRTLRGLEWNSFCYHLGLMKSRGQVGWIGLTRRKTSVQRYVLFFTSGGGLTHILLEISAAGHGHAHVIAWRVPAP